MWFIDALAERIEALADVLRTAVDDKGMSGLYLMQATWTAAASRGWSLTNLSHWWSEGPATLAGLTARKGRIAAGMDADLVVWSPEAPGVS